jgi:hypothetical protein
MRIQNPVIAETGLKCLQRGMRVNTRLILKIASNFDEERKGNTSGNKCSNWGQIKGTH